MYDGENVDVVRNNEILSFVVSPDSKEKAESCIMTFGHHDVNHRELKRSKVERPLFPSNSVGLSISSASPQNRMQNPRPKVSFHPHRNIDCRMSPNSEFYTHDSSCKRSDQAIHALGPHVSENQSMPHSFATNMHQNCYQSDFFPHYQIPFHFGHHQMAQMQAQRINSNYPPQGYRSQQRIHDESRGAFDSHRQRDPNDEEVEHILSNECRRKWQQSQWQNQMQLHQQQPQQMIYNQFTPMYHHDMNFAPVHHPQYHQVYNPNMAYPLSYPLYSDHLNQGFEYTNEMYMAYKNQHNHNNSTIPQTQPYNNPRKRKQGKESLSSTSPRQDYYIFTDRPISPMSDVSASPVPFDEDHCEQSDKPMAKGSFKKSNPVSSEHLHGISRSRKKLAIDTSFDESNMKNAEPKISRRKGKSGSKFNFDDDGVVRIISPLKGKTDDEKKLKSTSGLSKKIWRSKLKTSNLIITNNVSQTSSEQGEGHYI